MNMQQLVPASQLARTLGVKMLAYGDPGMGKTPIIETAPRPVLCACEPGLRSMASSNVPTWEAYTAPKAFEFLQWLTQSQEAANFDTVAIDSISQFAELVLEVELARNKDGRKAYGELSRTVYGWLNALYFMKYKHIYLICKKTIQEEGTLKKARPYFPGQDLNVKVPHLFDEILHMEKVISPKDGKMYPMFRTMGTDSILARDRSGQLAEFEQPHLGYLFNKCMQ